MKSLLLLTLTLFQTTDHLRAENFRSPAVLDGTCQLEINLANFKNAEEAQKAHCKAVRQCMNSAPDEQMAMLKNLEAAACSNTLKVAAPKTPTLERDENFDGTRAPRRELKIIPDSETPERSAIKR